MAQRPARTLALLGLLAGAAAITAPPLRAHTKPRAAREIVRLRGTVQSADDTCAQSTVTLRVFNKTIRLCGSDARRITVTTTEVAANQQLPAEYDLQGERAELAPATSAKPGERLTVLAEWRPGRRDLFLIALDVCRCAN